MYDDFSEPVDESDGGRDARGSGYRGDHGDLRRAEGRVRATSSRRSTASRSARVRAGLIVGPYDPTDRFTYWPRRIARGGDVLGPGRPGRAGAVRRRARPRALARARSRSRGRAERSMPPGRRSRSPSRSCSSVARDAIGSDGERRLDRRAARARRGSAAVDGAPVVAAGRRVRRHGTRRHQSRARRRACRSARSRRRSSTHSRGTAASPATARRWRTSASRRSLRPPDRIRIKREPHRGRYDRETIDAILDEGLICHLGFEVDGQPYVIPTLHARVGDTLYVHGSSASRDAPARGRRRARLRDRHALRRARARALGLQPLRQLPLGRHLRRRPRVVRGRREARGPPRADRAARARTLGRGAAADRPGAEGHVDPRRSRSTRRSAKVRTGGPRRTSPRTSTCRSDAGVVPVHLAAEPSEYAWRRVRDGRVGPA